MRIQHNIPALSAYRNYTHNVSAVNKNLEKLSSGYRINRAGDDAAGLAISEKMRIQITGLEQAQSNAKSGINLVQTAEGALTEVHDMLNRMYTLAEQSANGTYSDDVDREQLQKEVVSLRKEIDRIADATNYNGINLLDGSLEESDTTPTTKVDAQYEDVAADKLKNALGIPDAKTDGTGVAGTDTILEVTADGVELPSFTIDLDGISHVVSAGAAGSDAFTLTVGGNGTAQSISVNLSGDGEQKGDILSAADIAAKFDGKSVGIDGITYTAEVKGSKIKFTADASTTNAINAHYDVSFTGQTMSTFAGAKAKYAISGTYTTGSAAASVAAATVTITYKGTDMTFSVTGIAGTATLAQVVTALGDAKNADGEKLSKYVTVAASGTTQFSFESNSIGDGEGDDDKAAIVKAFEFTPTDTTQTVTDTNCTLATTGADKLTYGTMNFDQTGTGTINTGYVDIHTTGAAAGSKVANTILTLPDVQDGMKLKLGDEEYTFAAAKDSVFKNTKNVVDLTDLFEGGATPTTAELNEKAISRLTEVAKNNKTFIVGHDDATGAAGKITLQQRVSAKEDTDMETMDKLLSHIGLSKIKQGTTPTIVTSGADEGGKALTLQIGDTADEFNKMEVSIKDMHADAMTFTEADLGKNATELQKKVAAMGLNIGNIDISTQEGASAAMAVIKNATNYVSDVRGDLGALQNRLDHTINNLSVTQENITDAESTIRDVDVAKEMMAYTKNNILVQSAQAMLAQANQLPQGVLQLLG